jgi:hypothetical protein
VYQEQRTFYIYASEEHRNKGQYSVCMSDQKKFNAYKRRAKAGGEGIPTPLGNLKPHPVR